MRKVGLGVLGGTVFGFALALILLPERSKVDPVQELQRPDGNHPEDERRPSPLPDPLEKISASTREEEFGQRFTDSAELRTRVQILTERLEQCQHEVERWVSLDARSGHDLAVKDYQARNGLDGPMPQAERAVAAHQLRIIMEHGPAPLDREWRVRQAAQYYEDAVDASDVDPGRADYFARLYWAELGEIYGVERFPPDKVPRIGRARIIVDGQEER